MASVPFLEDMNEQGDCPSDCPFTEKTKSSRTKSKAQNVKRGSNKSAGKVRDYILLDPSNPKGLATLTVCPIRPVGKVGRPRTRVTKQPLTPVKGCECRICKQNFLPKIGQSGSTDTSPASTPRGLSGSGGGSFDANEPSQLAFQDGFAFNNGEFISSCGGIKAKYAELIEEYNKAQMGIAELLARKAHLRVDIEKTYKYCLKMGVTGLLYPGMLDVRPKQHHAATTGANATPRAENKRNILIAQRPEAFQQQPPSIPFASCSPFSLPSAPVNASLSSDIPVNDFETTQHSLSPLNGFWDIDINGAAMPTRPPSPQDMQVDPPCDLLTPNTLDMNTPIPTPFDPSQLPVMIGEQAQYYFNGYAGNEASATAHPLNTTGAPNYHHDMFDAINNLLDGHFGDIMGSTVFGNPVDMVDLTRENGGHQAVYLTELEPLDVLANSSVDSSNGGMRGDGVSKRKVVNDTAGVATFGSPNQSEGTADGGQFETLPPLE